MYAADSFRYRASPPSLHPSRSGLRWRRNRVGSALIDVVVIVVAYSQLTDVPYRSTGPSFKEECQ